MGKNFEGLNESQSLFYWITYSYNCKVNCALLIAVESQSLFYWITYSYIIVSALVRSACPESQSLFYWITYSYTELTLPHLETAQVVSILILLDYLFLFPYKTKFYNNRIESLNPYFIGLPILIKKYLK